MKIVGKQKVDYISKKTNQPVTGISLHCIVDGGSRVEGQEVSTVFVSTRSNMYDGVMKMPIGTEVIFSYNRWGSVDNIRINK